MKRWLLFLTIVFLVVAIIVLPIVFLKNKQVNIEYTKCADVRFVNGDVNIACSLDGEEVEILKSIFSKKLMYTDNPTCGFSEDVSIVFDKTQTFCIARDTCPIVFWKEKDRYISLTEVEQAQLYMVLEKHGCFFPCI